MKSSNNNVLTFKSSINAICLWWVYSVGLSIICYIIYEAFKYAMLCQLFKKQSRLKYESNGNGKDDFTLNFDDVISTVQGTVY